MKKKKKKQRQARATRERKKEREEEKKKREERRSLILPRRELRSSSMRWSKQENKGDVMNRLIVESLDVVKAFDIEKLP